MIVSVVDQAGLNLTLSETPKTGFLAALPVLQTLGCIDATNVVLESLYYTIIGFNEVGMRINLPLKVMFTSA